MPAKLEINWPESRVHARIREGPSYLGSVRFFKHVILGIVAALIIVPTTLSVCFGVQFARLKQEAAQFQAVLFRSESTALPAHEMTMELNGGGAEVPPWQSLFPELYAQPSERGKIDREKTVYLTFDDGPSARTPEILEILDQWGVKATFFVVGREDEQSKQWMRDIVAAGHTLGVHSYSHIYSSIYASVEDYLADFQRIYDLILEATGISPQVFRFPGGSINGYNAATYEEIIAEMVRRGFVYFDWNVSSGDAAKGHVTASSLISNCLHRADSLRRAVVLMHDSASRDTTVEALPKIIEGYQARGFAFAPLTPEVKPVVYSYPY